MHDDKFLETIITQAILDQVKPTWLDRVGNYIGLAIVLAIPVLYLIGKYCGQ